MPNEVVRELDQLVGDEIARSGIAPPRPPGPPAGMGLGEGVAQSRAPEDLAPGVPEPKHVRRVAHHQGAFQVMRFQPDAGVGGLVPAVAGTIVHEHGACPQALPGLLEVVPAWVDQKEARRQTSFYEIQPDRETVPRVSSQHNGDIRRGRLCGRSREQCAEGHEARCKDDHGDCEAQSGRFR